MVKKLLIPFYAKVKAREALEFNRKYPKEAVGLNKTQAKKLGIDSGIERAKQIIDFKYLSFNDAKKVAAFYNRFKNINTVRGEMAINLWGGRKFGQLAIDFVNNPKNK